MKKLNKNLLTLFAALTTVIATTVATSACIWFTHQPEEPKSLRVEYEFVIRSVFKPTLFCEF